MTTIQKSIVALVGAVLIGWAIYGAYQYPKSQVVSFGSPTGTTFNTAKIAAINVAPTSASATSTSILNSDASDRIITDSFVSCTPSGTVFAQTAAGLSSWVWTMATTSTNAPATITNTNSAAVLTVATSTTIDSYTASSTSPASATNRRWAAGSYLTIQPNGTSSTAACNVGVHYLAS